MGTTMAGAVLDDGNIVLYFHWSPKNTNTSK